ncbi:MAG: ClpX C4-type zinc finger protein [Blastocatellia bacterium]
MNERTPSVTPHSDFGGSLIAQPQKPVLRCSFCGLGEGEVARLFEGHSGYICDECVDVCVQLLHDYREMGIRPPKLDQPWYKKLLGDDGSRVGQCGFNIHDRNNPQGARLFAGISAQICDKCVRACEVLKSSLVLSG